MSAVKRLTPPQSRKVNALVKRECCNCVDGKCLLLDDGDACVCVQAISYSLICRYFREAVLPADKQLYAEITRDKEIDLKRCAICKNTFAARSNRAKYCPACAGKIRRRQKAESERSRRLRLKTT